MHKNYIHFSIKLSRTYSFTWTHHQFKLMPFFSTEYKPLIPLTQNYAPIFIHPLYAKCQISKPYSSLIYFIPAGLMAINNYLTEWSIMNSAIFGSLIIGSLFVRQVMKGAHGLVVHSLQVDPYLKTAYITVPASFPNKQLFQDNMISSQQKRDMLDEYYPVRQKYPGVVIRDSLDEFLLENKNNSKANIKGYLDTIKLEMRVLRLKLPLQNLKFRVKLKKEAEPEFERDKERLTQRQMLRKYENYLIQLLIPIPPSQHFKKNKMVAFKIVSDLNVNKKYHDYLLALALGYRIDTSDNHARKKEEKKEKENGEVITDESKN